MSAVKQAVWVFLLRFEFERIECFRDWHLRYNGFRMSVVESFHWLYRTLSLVVYKSRRWILSQWNISKEHINFLLKHFSLLSTGFAINRIESQRNSEIFIFARRMRGISFVLVSAFILAVYIMTGTSWEITFYRHPKWWWIFLGASHSRSTSLFPVLHVVKFDLWGTKKQLHQSPVFQKNQDDLVKVELVRYQHQFLLIMFVFLVVWHSARWVST